MATSAALREPKDALRELERIARVAGKVVMEHYGQRDIETILKADRSYVSAADLACRDAVVNEFARSFRGVGIISEESGQGENEREAARGTFAVLDPIDGTHNFLRGVPIFTISIGLVDGHQQIAGVAFNPGTAQMYSAVRGGGAFLNSTRLSVSGVEHIEDAVIGADHAKVSEISDGVVSMLRRAREMRTLYSTAYEISRVADGWFSAYVGVGIKQWDIAASSLAVTEAGGTWSLLNGERPAFPIFGPISFVAASTERLHSELLEVLNGTGSRTGP